MKFLITGGLGFIGSHFVEKIARCGHEIVVVDKLTQASTIENLSVDIISSVELKIMDISSRNDLFNNLRTHFGTFDWVINFAAESHVDRSIDNGVPFCDSNVLGVVNILEFMKSGGGEKMIQISTDEVYGSIRVGNWNEETALCPRNPYSASKAAAELFCNAYKTTHGLNIIITRSSNNFGSRQAVEKFIPKIIYKILNQEKVPVYGDGTNKREWIFVNNYVDALYSICEKKVTNFDSYNFGGYEISNIDLVQKIIKKLNGNINSIDFIKDRLGHDFRYALDDSRFKKEFSVTQVDFESGLDQTIIWYVNNIAWMRESAKRANI
jgi:dTDP-glucose 4,6-dehydratase